MLTPAKRPKLPEKGLWMQAIAIPIALIGIQLIVVSAARAVEHISKTEPTQNAWILILTGALLCPLCLLTYYSLVKIFAKRKVEELATKNAGKEILAGAGLGASLISLPMIILWISGNWQFSGMSVSSEIWQGIGIGLVSCVFEELLFRGVMFRLLDSLWGPVWAITLSTVVFAGLHLMNPGMTGLGVVALALEAGPLLAAAYLWNRRLWLPIGVHFGWNAMQASFWGVNVSGTGKQLGLLNGVFSGPDWLTGGSVGIEGSLVTAIINLIVTTIMLYVIKKRHTLATSTSAEHETTKNSSTPQAS